MAVMSQWYDHDAWMAENSVQAGDLVTLTSGGYGTFTPAYARTRPSQPTREQRIAAQQALAEAAALKIAELESRPEEPPKDSVICFTKRFGNSKKYSYSAIRAGDGLWYTTGPKSPKGYTWEQLLDWMEDWRACNINVVAAWEGI